MSATKTLTPERIASMTRAQAETVRSEVIRDMRAATGDHARRLSRALLFLDHHLVGFKREAKTDEIAAARAWLKGEPTDGERERNARAWEFLHGHERRPNPFGLGESSRRV